MNGISGSLDLEGASVVVRRLFERQQLHGAAARALRIVKSFLGSASLGCPTEVTRQLQDHRVPIARALLL